MGVQVDQSRRDKFAGRAQHLEALVGGNVLSDRLDHPVANADVPLGPQILAGVQHLTALDQEVELIVGPHGRDSRAACRGKGETGCGVRKELTAREREHGISSNISIAA
jgi:hypothetical protein